MRAKQIRVLDNNANTVAPSGIIVVTADKANWSRPGPIIPLIADGRITVDTARDTTSQAPETNKNRLSYAMHHGALISIYGGGSWAYYDFGPFIDFTAGVDLDADNNSIANSTPYDVFVFDSGGLELELVPWNNATSPGVRIVNLTRLDGIWVKSTDFTRRYVGTVVTNGSALFDDNNTRRMVWNAYNQVLRSSVIVKSTSSLVNATTSSSGADLAQFPGIGSGFEFVVGLDTQVKCESIIGGFVSTGAETMLLTLGLDSITTEAPGTMGCSTMSTGSGVPATTSTLRFVDYTANHSIIAPGDHHYRLLYRSTIPSGSFSMSSQQPAGSAQHGMTLSLFG